MKRPLSLLEVVIALGLTAILLTTLFSCYRHLVLSKNQIDKIREDLYPKMFLQARLLQIFDNLEEGQPFYTQEGVLKFKFDHGIDRDPKYCGIVEGELYQDGDKFILRLNDDRTEVLRKGPGNFSFKFLDLKKGGLVDEWRGTLLPAQVRISVAGETMFFSIPNTEHMVTYK